MAEIPGFHLDLMNRVASLEQNMAGKDEVEVRFQKEDFEKIAKAAGERARGTLNPAVVGDSPPPPTKSPVANLAQELVETQNMTDSLLDILRSKLEPVLRGAKPSEANGPSVPECCPIGDFLRSRIDTQHHMNALLNDLLDRIAI